MKLAKLCKQTAAQPKNEHISRIWRWQMLIKSTICVLGTKESRNLSPNQLKPASKLKPKVQLVKAITIGSHQLHKFSECFGFLCTFCKRVPPVGKLHCVCVCVLQCVKILSPLFLFSKKKFNRNSLHFGPTLKYHCVSTPQEFTYLKIFVRMENTVATKYMTLAKMDGSAKTIRLALCSCVFVSEFRCFFVFVFVFVCLIRFHRVRFFRLDASLHCV